MSYQQAVIYIAEFLRTLGWFYLGTGIAWLAIMLAMAASWVMGKLLDRSGRKLAAKLLGSYDRDAHFRQQYAKSFPPGEGSSNRQEVPVTRNPDWEETPVRTHGDAYEAPEWREAVRDQMSREAASGGLVVKASALSSGAATRNILVRAQIEALSRDLQRAAAALSRLPEMLVPVPCPACAGAGRPAVLSYLGPFDGSEPSTGVTAGHEGFGDTYMCGSGHWYAAIPVCGIADLVPADRILTVVC